MFRLFHSMFGSSATKGGYPESLVKEAIERAVDGTDPWIRGVSGYQKKLRPAVIKAIDHVVALVDSLPSPLVIGPGSYGSDPRLRAFFISTDDMRKTFGADRNLNDFRRTSGETPPQVFALLTIDKQEKGILGVELSGDIVMHGVPQITVSFEDHRLIDPTASEVETRRQLKRRAYDHLLGLALRRIALLKSERSDLDRRRSLLQSKLSLLERSGWGFEGSDSSESLTVAGVEELLGTLEAQLQELGGDDRILEAYLDIVADVLGRPEEQLWGRQIALFVDRMGIKRTEAADDAPELTLFELENAGGVRRIAALVALSGELLLELPE